ncbi:putative aldouronate transport system permease protein [Paenibacillus sp. 1_12]|uniref:ABC transporter permease n=1 Tax=Paenibacillus sp. 1_12 TaxID=1566278 RepID=UPI0008E23AA6|nr:ABC transporter permease subunit [Paenibacillus sp. 1_12]SFL56160.1 putative aldouronate transport system permease protein [Paenibacillus sp. 1_12]
MRITLKTQYHYLLMLIPGLILLLLFEVIPLFGSVLAFQNYIPGVPFADQEWVGLDNFEYMFLMGDSKIIFGNTIFIASMKIFFNLLIPLFFALLLNEVRSVVMKRWVQTILYLPHFLSWVILAGILTEILSLNGIVNQMLKFFHFEPIMFLAKNSWFPGIIIGSDVWKDLGFNLVIYLAALAGINPSLYEAAEVDGASRFQRIWYITLPGISSTVILLATLGIANFLNAGFDQIFNLYNPAVYQSGDIIDTYVYRAGLLQMQYSLATALGLLKSVLSFILIIVAYTVANRFNDYRIF